MYQRGEDSESEDDYDDDPDAPPRLDWDAMPEFELSCFEGGREYSSFARMYMTEEEWSEMKALNIELDDTIVECAMDEQKRWRFLRFRGDKKDGNHISVVHSVLESIKDGITQGMLLANAQEIRTAWKVRIGAQAPAVLQKRR